MEGVWRGRGHGGLEGEGVWRRGVWRGGGGEGLQGVGGGDLEGEGGVKVCRGWGVEI